MLSPLSNKYYVSVPLFSHGIEKKLKNKNDEEAGAGLHQALPKLELSSTSIKIYHIELINKQDFGFEVTSEGSSYHNFRI